MTTVTHDHGRGRPYRNLAGRTGIWVQWCGDWRRPLYVWLYLGAWRVVCHVCVTIVRPDDPTQGLGWASQQAAMDAAAQHCKECEGTTP